MLALTNFRSIASSVRTTGVSEDTFATCLPDHVGLGQEHNAVKQKPDRSVLSLTEIPQRDEIRIFMAGATFSGEVLHIFNGGTQWAPCREILLETETGLSQWREEDA